MNTIIENDAIIFLPKNKINEDTYNLTKKITESPAFSHVRVMPDCHSSSYCCVGMTSIIEDKVIPQIVGGDIGCGISCINLNNKHFKIHLCKGYPLQNMFVLYDPPRETRGGK